MYFKLWTPVAIFMFVGMAVYYVLEYYLDMKKYQSRNDSEMSLIDRTNEITLSTIEGMKDKKVELKLGGDTYAMAFKAMNTKAC